MIYISVLAGLFTIFLYAYSTVLLDYFLIQDVRVLTPTFFFLRGPMQQALEAVDDTVTKNKNDAISFIQTMKEAASETLGFDYAAVKREVMPMLQELRIREHIGQYIEKLVPIMTQFMDEYSKATDSVVSRVEPDVQELKQIFRANSDHTKARLIPILNVFEREFTNVLSRVKQTVSGYVEEYGEQIENYKRFISSHTEAQIEGKRTQMRGVLFEIYEKLLQLQEITLREVN